MTVAEKLAKTGPRKLLALDGGGIRGVVTVEVLAKIEAYLQAALGKDDTFVLADYFDYIGGTSTGAVIASTLAMGMRVDKVRSFYTDSSREMFDKSSLRQRFQYKFRNDKLTQRLKDELGADTTLGSDRLRTLLMLVMRNATTNSPWPISNNPHAKFNAPGAQSNLHLPLWQLVRASTAAPTYFAPEVIDVVGQSFVFVDGGVSVFNNPAFQLFLMATVEPYNLCWQAGQDEMLLVSIGTGTNTRTNAKLAPGQMNLLYNAGSIPAALMGAAAQEQDFLCRAFGACAVGDPLDSEIGDMIGASGPAQPKLFTYLRYNPELSRQGLDALGLPHIQPEQIQPLDAVEQVYELQQIGQKVAERVLPEHFARFLD